MGCFVTFEQVYGFLWRQANFIHPSKVIYRHTETGMQGCYLPGRLLRRYPGLCKGAERKVFVTLSFFSSLDGLHAMKIGKWSTFRCGGLKIYLIWNQVKLVWWSQTAKQGLRELLTSDPFVFYSSIHSLESEKCWTGVRWVWGLWSMSSLSRRVADWSCYCPKIWPRALFES